MIRFAEKKDVHSIIELWDIAFPEEPDFNKYFFKNVFDCKSTLIMVRDNELLSMAQMIPYEIKGAGKATYIYGAATNPKYRKQGLMSELLKKSFEIDIEKGVSASILIPANKQLFDYYGRLGYERAFYVIREIYKAGKDIDNIKEVQYCHIPRLMSLYNGEIIRTEAYWKTQINMYKALGGKIFIYNNAYAVVSDKVEELMYSDERDKEVLLNSVCRYLKCDEVEITVRGEKIPLGMIKKHRKFNMDKGYMNLMYN